MRVKRVLIIATVITALIAVAIIYMQEMPKRDIFVLGHIGTA